MFLPLKLTLKNYKCFPSIAIPLDQPILIIYGSNGSGKTQLIWAILLFLRAYNIRVGGKKSFNLLPNLADLLCHTPYRYLDSFCSFANTLNEDADSTDIPFILSRENAIDSCMVLYVNGKVEFQIPTDPSFPPLEKIAFAYASFSFHFHPPKVEEIGDFEILTSSANNIRLLFSTLPIESKDFISSKMTELFGCKSIEQTQVPRKYDINIVEENSYQREIMFCGSAFQKIFVGFVLLECLINKSEAIKFFLMEEIETLLDERLLNPYFISISNRCEEKMVQLFISSNSTAIVNSVFPSTLLHLSNA